jgi:hypothetical protein
MPIQKDRMLLRMALAGYEVELQKIQQKIAQIEAELGGHSRRGPASDALITRSGRQMSAAARRRIAAAQKKRWAAFHKKQKAA